MAEQLTDTPPEPLAFRLLGPDDLPELTDFLTGEAWPFHGRPHLLAADVQRQAGRGVYWGDDVETHLLFAQGQSVGLLRLFDLEDITALFDLRFTASARGQGRGHAAVRWLASHLFGTRPDLQRIEAHTRVDNLAMRGVLLACGFVLEAYHRQAWPQEGVLHDSVGYALLRGDWASGTVTPIPPEGVPWGAG